MKLLLRRSISHPTTIRDLVLRIYSAEGLLISSDKSFLIYCLKKVPIFFTEFFAKTGIHTIEARPI